MRLTVRSEPVVVYWDPELKKLTDTAPDPAGRAHSFTLRDIDFWEWQTVLEEVGAVDRMRAALREALIAVDGDTAGLAEFIDRPAIAAGQIVNALWLYLQGESEGN